ncbi:hypothetical protein JJB09_08145 [Rhizobium sp. KVB221]|uniref:Uncharacterized protein n=1 Tax=Rhizobium setariae TaxID=2801340 RepID=A0A936YPE2_9HYPH|nr:hypothetical protein [Rhizobium setariae]MBL0371996.1 hypothetical protein [Rhizobium setariae]
MNYDLGDWERRKSALAPVLAAAADEGLIVREQAARLAEFLLGRGVGVHALPASVVAGNQPETLDTPIASERPSELEDSEAPRFIRGFHDILITIGIIIGLSGLVGLASVYAVFPAVIVLGEILIRRQRLALPAVVLTVAFILAACIAIQPLFDETFGIIAARWQPAFAGLVVMGLLALFYWRYRVPIAFALMCLAAYGTIVMSIAAVILQSSGDISILDRYPLVLAGLIGLFAALIFGTALYYDFSDRLRATRRSDVAFWLHLAAAPAILYTVITLVYWSGQSWFEAGTTAMQAAIIVFAVLVLMLIGIVLDRRAFVTSGLLSFGYAFKVLLEEGGIAQFLASTDNIGFVILLAVGVIVLTLGIGWKPLRRVVIKTLPDSLVGRVPPVLG